MSKTIFIADLHLDKKHPRITQDFLKYLKNLKKENIDALYILGDLFECWIGDDCADSTAHLVAQSLAELSIKTSVPIYYIHGNRDFLLGENFALQCRMTLLPEHHVINLYNLKTLILHGDTLCTDDVKYMKFREKVRNKKWQENRLLWPKSIRQILANFYRFISKQSNTRKSATIMDVNADTVNDYARHYCVQNIIHGHTHKPYIHEHLVGDKIVTRYVVGDWYEQGSVLEVSADNQRLVTLPL